MLMAEDDGGLRRQPELESAMPEIAFVEEDHRLEFSILDDDPEVEVDRTGALRAANRQFSRVARNAALDPDDGIGL